MTIWPPSKIGIGSKFTIPIPVEITYGLERICMFTQDVKNVFEIINSSEKMLSKKKEMTLTTSLSRDFWFLKIVLKLKKNK